MVWLSIAPLKLRDFFLSLKCHFLNLWNTNYFFPFTFRIKSPNPLQENKSLFHYWSCFHSYDPPTQYFQSNFEHCIQSMLTPSAITAINFFLILIYCLLQHFRFLEWNGRNTKNCTTARKLMNILHQDVPGEPSVEMCSTVCIIYIICISLFCHIRPWGNCGMRTSLCCSVVIEDTEPQLGQIFAPEAGKLGQSLCLSNWPVHPH